MNRITCAALGLVLAAAASGGEPKAGYDLDNGVFSVPLTVKENQGIERKTWPVSFGVPLSAGLARDTAGLRLLDVSGKEVPCQFNVLSRYWGRDDSLRWVLLCFQADVSAGGSAAYGPAPGQPAQDKARKGRRGRRPVRSVRQRRRRPNEAIQVEFQLRRPPRQS